MENLSYVANANGGYVMAVGARAMSAALGRPPLSVTAHYLNPGPVGEAIVQHLEEVAEA